MTRTSDNRRVVLARLPADRMDAGCFAVEYRPVARPGPGEVLVQNVYLSCDPYLRLEMSRGNFHVGGPITSRVAGVVADSGDDRWKPGDLAWGFLGWEEFSLARADALTRVDPDAGPLSHAITVRGMNGLTAWAGIVEVGRAAPGDTVVVSAGTGGVGSIAGQLARLAGARVVAVVGGERKVRHATDVLGYHAAIDRLGAVGLSDALAQACPDGVDVYFDNVGGEVLQAVAGVVRHGARLALCGAIADYDRRGPGEPVDLGVLNGSGASATWFSVYDYLHRLPAFAATMGRLVRTGEVVYVQDIVYGIERAPEALLGVFRGENLGKRLVQIADWSDAPPA